MSREITKSDIEVAITIAAAFCKKWRCCLSEDIRGCAYMGLVEAGDSYDGSSPFYFWLKIKVKQEIIDHFRTRYSNYRYKHEKHMPTRPERVLFNEDMPELSCDGLEDRVIAKDFLAKMLSFPDITQREKEFIRMRLEDPDMQIQNIGAELGMNENTAWVHNFRVREKLKRHWYED